MKTRSSIPLLRQVHAWIGLIIATVLLMLCASGMIILFYDELRLWEQPELLTIPTDQHKSLDENVRAVLSRYHLDRKRGIHIRLPGQANRTLAFQVPLVDRERKLNIEINPVTQVSVKPGGYRIVDFFAELHRSLLLPSPFGTYLVGALGLAMMLLISTGIFLHRNIFKAFFTLRTEDTRRILISDLHKISGLWPLAFHIMIAVTGATIGLSHGIQNFTERAAWQNMIAKEPETNLAEPMTTLPELGSMGSLDRMVELARAELPDATPYYLVLHNWERDGARVTVRSLLPDNLSRYAELKFDAVTLELVERFVHADDAGHFSRIFEATVALHFAAYGNAWIKAGYFLLAIVTAMLAISGSMLWLESRYSTVDRENRNKTQRVVMGFQIGFLFSCASLLLVYRVACQLVAADLSRSFYLALFLLIWVGYIGIVLLSKRPGNLLRRSIIQIAILLSFVSLTDILLQTWRSASTSIPITSSWPVLLPDIVLLGLSLVFFSCWLSLRSQGKN